MNHRMRRIVETLACERRYGIADAKGSEYSGAGSTYKETGADTLNNFKSVAERIGGTPEQVLMTYLLKHIDSINTTVREAATSARLPAASYEQGEGIVSRLDDARNYLDLLECLLIDNGHIPHPDTNPHVVPVLAWEGDAADYLLDTPERGVTREDLENAGLVEGLDGVWRGATKVDESVPPNALKETPICGPPPVQVQPTMDKVRDPIGPSDSMGDRYGETGELEDRYLNDPQRGGPLPEDKF